MKIAFIISSLSSGGAERVLVNLANHLSKKHEVYIVVFSEEEPYYKLNENIKLLKFDLLKNSINKFQSLINTSKRIYCLRKVLKNIDADINISFMIHTNILAIIASKLNKQKIIIAERTVYDFYQSKLLNIIRKKIYPKADLLITQTLADKKNYSFMKNVEVVYNPLELPIIKQKKENKILAVGRLDKQKGFDKLINAFSSIENSDWQLCIAGNGIEKDNLIRLIEELEIDNIELIGNRRDIFDWYAKASIFVLSSQKEGFPNVLLEAMGYGCACVSFDCPNGPSEIIENEVNGVLVENQNIKKLSFEMQRLIDDKELRGKLSNEAIKIKDKYTIKKIANQWESLINKVIND